MSSDTLHYRIVELETDWRDFVWKSQVQNDSTTKYTLTARHAGEIFPRPLDMPLFRVEGCSNTPGRHSLSLRRAVINISYLWERPYSPLRAHLYIQPATSRKGSTETLVPYLAEVGKKANNNLATTQ